MNQHRSQKNQQGSQQNTFGNLKITNINSMNNRIIISATNPGWNYEYKFVVSKKEVIGQTSVGAWEPLSNCNSQLIRNKLKSFLIDGNSPLSS